MLRLLLGRDWTANRREILSRLARDVAQRKGNRILMVPELISHETERRLCMAAGDTASRYAEVLSFTRLARRVSDGMGSAAVECLDSGGRVVAMAAAAKNLSSQLKAYAAVETKPEFLTGLIEGIDEFKRCCITPEDLRQAAQQTEGSLAQKLEELSLLMAAYDALCARGKRDPRDQMTWLLEQLEEGDFAREHVFYIDGFPDFTRQNFAIIEHLIRESPCVSVSLNCDSIGSSELAFEKAGDTAQALYRSAVKAGVEIQIEVIPGREDRLGILREKLFQGALHQGIAKGCIHPRRADMPYMACMDAAHQLRQLVREGARYRDIAVVCGDMGTYQPIVNLVFHRFHIPLYQSGTEDILQKSVIATVLTALDGALSGFDQKQTLRYLRSALSPLDPDICDLVENYAILWGIRGQKWVSVWENHPEGLSGEWDAGAKELLARLNAAREEGILPLERLRLKFREATNVCGQVEALDDFLEEIRLRQRLEELAQRLDEAGDNRNAQVLYQLWEILTSALEQMYDVLGETHWEAEHFARLLRLLLSQYDVGTIPPVLDAVQMGEVAAMRCHEQKVLIVLGAEEGKLPGYSGSTGILTDQERTALRQLGVPLTGGAMEGVQAEFAEIYGVFCGAQETVYIYSAEEQPSFLFGRLASLAGGVESVEPGLGFADADAQEAGTALARWGKCEAADRLGLLQQYQTACEHRDYTLGDIGPEGVRKLYGNTLNLSASQIDCQAECRTSYFLKYGLRARERKEASVDPAEFGTYVHAVLENTARCIRDRGGFHQVSLEETLEIAHRYSEAYAQERFSQIDSQRLTYLFRRNVQELDMVVEELWLELKESEFEPIGFEVGFGRKEEMEPIAIPNGSMNALLRGFVDRVDCWRRGGRNYFRVVDYKTGKKDFDYCDVFNGVGLQMLLYLFTLREDGESLLGENPIPAGVQYFPARAPYLPLEGRPQEDAAQKKRDKEWKRKGLLLEDVGVLRAMEPGESPNRSFTVKKDGTLSGDLASAKQFEQLKDYIFELMAHMVQDISSGNIEPNPYTRGSSHNACDRCPYGTVCHQSQVEGRRNYKAMTAQRFWEELERSLNHGR